MRHNLTAPVDWWPVLIPRVAYFGQYPVPDTACFDLGQYPVPVGGRHKQAAERCKRSNTFRKRSVPRRSLAASERQRTSVDRAENDEDRGEGRDQDIPHGAKSPIDTRPR